MSGKFLKKMINYYTKKFRKNGFIKIKNFFTKNEIEKTKKKINKFYGLEKKGTLWAPHFKDIYFLNLICKKKIQQILIPILNDPYYKLIPKNKPNYILGEYIGLNLSSRLHLHIDSWKPSSSINTWMLQLGILLHDRNKNSGCTTYVKNSHKSDSYSNRYYKKLSYLEGKAGDLIIWDSRLWHGRSASKNKNIQSWILVATLQSWYLKARFDYTKSIPKKIYLKMSKVEKQIVGLCSVPPKNEKEGFNGKKGYEILK